MEKQNIFKKLKWDSIIVAALTIILGLLCVILPKGSGTALTYIFGAALVAMGITAVVRYFWGLRLISDMSLVIGTLMITLGVFTLINPSAIQAILVVLLGVFIIIDSMTEISESIYCARANVSGWFWLFLASVLTLGLGIVVAFSNFETVITYQENNELLYYALAQAYEANNEIDKAISNYLKAIAVNDKFTLAYKKVGVLFLARNDYEDAIEYFEDYLNFDIPQEEKDSVEKLVERINAKL